MEIKKSLRECPEPGQLERFLLGKLSDDQVVALSDHLLHCRQCAVVADSIDSHDELTNDLAKAPIGFLDPSGRLQGAIETSARLTHDQQAGESTFRMRDLVSAPQFDAKSDNDAGAFDASDSVPFQKPVTEGEYPVVPGYEILGILGTGGMGVVYQARQSKLNRMVALKMIRAHALFDSESMKRFQVEAESVARLSHPNIISIYEIGESNRLPYVALEYVSDGSLAERISHTTLTSKAAAKLVAKLANAISYAHEQGVIHRDIKPANILVGTEIRSTAEPTKPQERFARSRGKLADDLCFNPKISDFGLALLSTGDDRQTRSGAIIGTPAYMAPEQALGQHTQVDRRADIYALGAILYELLTGRPPFRAESPMETLRQVTDDEPLSPRALNGDVPKDLETICMKCLQKNPAGRYDTASELADDIQRYLRGEPVKARPISAPVRLARWSRRRPAIASLVVATAALLITIAVGSTIFAIRVARLNQETIKAKQDSENDRSVAVTAITELSNALYRDLARRGGTIKEREQLIAVALEGLQQVTRNQSRLADSGAIFAHLATAELHGLQGNLESAGQSIDRAFKLATDLVTMFPKETAHAYALARVHEARAALALATHGIEPAVPEIERATEILKPLIEREPDNPQLLHLLLRVRRQMVSIHVNRQDAEAIYRECTEYLPMAERLNELTDDGTGREVLGEVQRLLQYAALQMGDNSLAERHGESAIGYFTELKQAAPEDTVAAFSYWQAIQNRAMEHSLSGRHVEATRDMDAAIRGYRELAAMNPESLEAQYALADGLRWKCYQSCYAYDFQRVKTAGYESIDILRDLIRRSPSNHHYKAGFVASTGHVAEMARYEGDWQELDQRLEEALTIYRSLDPANINMAFEGSYGTVFESVWEATQRHLSKFQGTRSADGTCALVCTYAFLESMQGRFELSEQTQADLRRTCGLELADQDSLFLTMHELPSRSEFWIASTMIHEAIVFGYLAEQATDEAKQAEYLARSVAAIQRVKTQHPRIAEMRLPVKMELKWVRQTDLYQQEIGGP